MSTSDKLLSVLGLFTADTPEWTVEAAAKHLNLAVSTTYRYFRSLSEVGLIVAFAAGRYVLGPAIIHLDRQTRLLDPLIRTARPVMERLIHQVGAPGVLLLCRLYRNQVMCVHQERSGDPERAVSYERGRLMPLHRGAASKAILAHMPMRLVRAFHRDHAREMEAVSLGRTWDEVKRHMRQLRTAGVCVTHAELDPGVTGIAVPLFYPDGGVVGSLGLVLPDAGGMSQAVAGLSGLLRFAGGEIGVGLETLATDRAGAGDEQRAIDDRVAARRSGRSAAERQAGRTGSGGNPDALAEPQRRVAGRR